MEGREELLEHFMRMIRSVHTGPHGDSIDGVQASMIAHQLKLGIPGLQGLCYRYLGKPDKAFQPGDVVRWKSGLKNLRWPLYGQPCVVIKYEPGQLTDGDDDGSSSWRAPKDLWVGMLDSKGELEFWWVDSQRFERCKAEDFELMELSMQQLLKDHKGEFDRHERTRKHRESRGE